MDHAETSPAQPCGKIRLHRGVSRSMSNQCLLAASIALSRLARQQRAPLQSAARAAKKTEEFAAMKKLLAIFMMLCVVFLLVAVVAADDMGKATTVNGWVSDS